MTHASDGALRGPWRAAPAVLWQAWSCVAAVMAAELAVTGRGSDVGVAVYAVLLLALLMWSASVEEKVSHLIVAVSLIPLARILLFVSAADFGSATWRMTLSGLLLVVATALLAHGLGYRARRDLRLSARYLIVQLVCAAYLGLVLVALLGSSARSGFAVAVGQPAPHVLEVATLVLVIAFAHELLFRGLLLTAATRLLGSAHAVLFVGVLYGLLYAAGGSWMLALAMAAVGVVFCVVSLATRSLVAVVAASAIAEFVLLLAEMNAWGLT